jgi:hypothetical protein
LGSPEQADPSPSGYDDKEATMTDQPTLEVVIDTIDEDVIRSIEETMSTIESERWKNARDIVTVLTIASSAVALVNALLTLKDRLAGETRALRVTVKNTDREEVDLTSATREDLERLLAERKD